ncbi:zinc finger and BTB domain-containing protein 5-like [Solea solea]|uniref:zinc finger and BTB domain-containing protein 5-like n=1 Tax=Solea solea TaxID=90069 RepID=UPI00272C7F49|nr:zinc finger and BTB domain-containing protein 5-like [Solea solea]
MDFPGHFQHIFKQLNHQRLHAQLCDCVVVVGGQSFQAHRSILAACSSHFRALLSSNDSAEEVEGARADRGPSMMELDAEVVTPDAFSTLLDMIYTSTLSLGASNVMDVLLAASHLHLNTVVKACKLHLSRKNFPASPPKGWRSVQQQQQSAPSKGERSFSLQKISSAVEEEEEEEEDLDDDAVVVEVSQSGVGEDQGVRRRVSDKQSAATSSCSFKRKSHEERLSCGKRSCRLPGENYKECSPTVSSRSMVSAEESEGLLFPDQLLESQVDEEEEEEKYEAPKGETEEIQLPSQSDSSTGGVCVWKMDGDTDGDTVVKIKVGEEAEEDETKMAVIEIKKENLCSYSSGLESLSLSHDCTEHLGNDEKMAASANTAVADINSLQSQLCTDLQRDAHRDVGGLCEDSEALDSLSELAFSCFLNPTAESVMGALEEDDSLASLTAAATAAAAASDDPAAAGNVGETCQNSPDANASSAHNSLVFPMSSVPLQQLLPPQSPGFSDTLILQPTQNSLAGFLSGMRPGLSLEASLVQPTRVVKSSGATTFRRIAPKVPPGSEASTDPSSSSVGEAADRSTLTRASDDVLSKCKKAAAEDHVLLVEGDKKYACNICCKKFMNLTDCKKHIRVHTGEKPYPCPKCGKRFSQSSHLYKHSKNTCLNWKDDQSFPETLH